jgi:hypothetical protein
MAALAGLVAVLGASAARASFGGARRPAVRARVGHHPGSSSRRGGASGTTGVVQARSDLRGGLRVEPDDANELLRAQFSQQLEVDLTRERAGGQANSCVRASVKRIAFGTTPYP